MSWAEIKKAVNSDLSTPLNSKIDAQTTALNSKFGWHVEEKGTIRFDAKTFSKDGLLMVYIPNTSSSCYIYEGTSASSNTGIVASLSSANAGEIIIAKKNTSYFFNGASINYIFLTLGGGI